MAFVRNKQGVIGEVPDKDLKRAIEHFGYTAVSEQEVAADKAEYDKEKEAGEHPFQAAGESAVKGAMNMATAIPRALAGAGEAIAGPNAVSDTIAGMNGDNTLRAIKGISQGWGGNAADVDAETAKYMQDVGRREEANPVASGLGEFGGSIVGAGPLAGAAGPTGAVTTKALGGGLAARAAGTAVEGGVFGGIAGVAGAVDREHQQDSYLHGEQLVAAVGPGMLWGGVLNLAGKSFGEIKALRGKKGAIPEVPDLVAREAEAATPRTTRGGKNMDLPEDVRRNIAPFMEEGAVDSFANTERVDRSAIPDLEQKTVPGGRRKVASTEEPPLREAPDLEVPTSAGRKTASKALQEAASIPDLETSGARVRSTDFEASTKRDSSIGGHGGDELTLTPRRTKYNASHDFGEDPVDYYSGKGKDLDVTDFRKALDAEDLHMRNRGAKVEKMLQVVPENATADYILEMTDKERAAFADFMGVTKPSDATWRALADAVEARSGGTTAEASGHLPPPELQQAEPYESGGRALGGGPRRSVEEMAAAGRMTGDEGVPAINAAQGTPGPYKAATRTPEDLAAIGKLKGDEGVPAINKAQGTPEPYKPKTNTVDPGAIPADYVPPINSAQGTPGPYKPAAGGGGSDYAIGQNISGKVDDKFSIPLARAEEGQSGWKKFLANAGKQVAKRTMGRAIGSAVGAIAGGPVGGIVGYAAGHALDKAGAFNKMSSLVSKGAALSSRALDTALEVGSRVPDVARLGVEANIVYQHFYQQERTPEAAFKRRMEELTAMNANLAERVGNAFGPLAFQEQGAVIAATQAAQRGIDYLLKVAPRMESDETSLTPVSSASPPNRADLNAFGRVYTAVMQPKSVLADIAAGTVTSDQIEAVKTVYPQWYQENIAMPLGEKLVARDATHKELLPPERRVIDTVLGAHSGVESFQFANSYGDKFAEALMPGQPGNPSQKSGRQLGRRSGISAMTQTQTSKMLGPIQ